MSDSSTLEMWELELERLGVVYFVYFKFSSQMPNIPPSED